MNSRLPQITFIYNRRKTASNSVKAAVEIRITHNYKQKYISTGVMLYPNQWKNGKIVNCPDIMEISQTLDKMLSDVRKVILEMVDEENIDIFAITDRLSGKSKMPINFIDFCKRKAQTKKYGKTKGRQMRYDCFIRVLEKCNLFTEFKDVTEGNIIAFDAYLASRNLKLYTKWHNYHEFLKAFIKDAINEGLLVRNPYNIISIDTGDNTGGKWRYLTPDEFRIIKGASLPTESLRRVRDVFVFQTYTCFSYIDMRDFNALMVQEMKGMKVYTGYRHKTKIPFTIPILSPAWDILMKYEGKLPIISNVKYNKYLKLVAQHCGIDKPISSHWARHTGATMLLNEGIEMKIVSKICGHSSTKITELIYAKLLDETVVDAVKDLEI